jgi:hypothetical protein
VYVLASAQRSRREYLCFFDGRWLFGSRNFLLGKREHVRMGGRKAFARPHAHAADNESGGAMFSWSSRVLAIFAAAFLTVSSIFVGAPSLAATPIEGRLDPPTGSGTQSVSVTWSGGPYTMATPTRDACVAAAVNCDRFKLVVNVPATYWDWSATNGSHEGGVTIEINWASTANDFDMFVYEWSDTNVRNRGKLVGQSASGGTRSEKVHLPKAKGGAYLVETNAWLAANATYSGRATLTATSIPASMVRAFPDTRDTITSALTVDYPLNVIFVGYKPTAQELAELRRWIPDEYKPTVGAKSPGGDEAQNAEAGLLNWNQNHLINSDPYFLGLRYRYKVRIFQATDDYARALFGTAKANTALGQKYHAIARGDRGVDQAKYDTLYGSYRVLAKNGDAAYKVTDPTAVDLVDAYAVEDWIFNSRYDLANACAFTIVLSDVAGEAGACRDASIIQPDPSAYHDPFYDKNGLNLDRMPQGLNAGSSFFFLDTFTPDYAKSYFRPNAYHVYGTDKVINGAIVPKPVEEGGSWRVTDPDSKGWAGVDFARTWGGRYRFHFVDLGAAPNNYESASWAKYERTFSSDYPFGDPPVWQYQADPNWRQTTDSCTADPQVLNYNGGTPCRIMPRLGRDVTYGLVFRSTAGYLYRPIPRGDVYWLAVNTWTDFYSRPQWTNGQLTTAPWYGAWWTNTDLLYRIGPSGATSDDVLRWLSSAMPYANWVGRKGEEIPLYDPTSNKANGKTLNTSPKYADLPAPKFHVSSDAAAVDLLPEPLYPGDDKPVVVNYANTPVNLTEISNQIEKAKAHGIAGTYDLSVSDTAMRDFIDAHRAGIADIVEGVNTIPAVNVVFEKAYTWALPVIVGGIATGTADGEAWGVFNNVNDRFKWDRSNYPAPKAGDPDPKTCDQRDPTTKDFQAGCKRSSTDVASPTQSGGSGFSYTIEHEAAHNLGLSHPHDGSYGVSRCPDTQAERDRGRAGTWQCYWQGLGWMFDISAAPTTYAMDYRPYEVEDQDNLQRGHIAEYLLAGQERLRARLIKEADAAATAPSAAWSADYGRYKSWMAQASDLFKKGDYLHAEYAARNSAIAAKGVLQSATNTINPALVGAGQVFYFNVNPQETGPVLPDLVITDLVASQPRPRQTILTATVANTGLAPASNVVVRFTDGTTLIGDAPAVAALGRGKSAKVTVTWNTRGIRGDRSVTAAADPLNAIKELSETNNSLTRTITVRGNRVANGSFETPGTPSTTPQGWTGSGAGGYDTSGAHATDGKAAVSLTGNGGPASALGATWTSAPIAVTAGATYDLAMTVSGTTLSSAPALNVTYLDTLGAVLSTVTGVTTTITGTAAAQEVLGQIAVPAGASQLRIQLTGFAPGDLKTGGTVWFDDIWLW